MTEGLSTKDAHPFDEMNVPTPLPTSEEDMPILAAPIASMPIDQGIERQTSPFAVGDPNDLEMRSSSPAQEVEAQPPDREIVASPDSFRSTTSSPDEMNSRPSNGHSIPSPLSSSTHFSHAPFPLRSSESISAAHAQRRAAMPVSPTDPTGSSSSLYGNGGGGGGATDTIKTSSRPTSTAMRRVSGSSAFSHRSGHRPAPASPGPSRRTSGVLSITKEEDQDGLTSGLDGLANHQVLRARSTSKSSMGASSSWSSSGMSRVGSSQHIGGTNARARPPSQLIPIPGRDDDAWLSKGGADSNTPSRMPSPVEEIPDTTAVGIPSTTNSRSDGFLSIMSPQSTSARSIPSISASASFPPRIRLQVTVRDFAFSNTDERYHGRTELSMLSATRSTASSDIEDYSNSPGGGGSASTAKAGRRKSSFGGWSGFNLGGFGWGSLRTNRDKRKSSSGSQEAPGRAIGAVRQERDRFGGTEIDTDLDLSSDMTPSSSYGLANESDGFLSSKSVMGIGESSASMSQADGRDVAIHADDAEEKLMDEHEPGAECDLDEEEDLGPEPRGRFKVVYAFEAEGEPEMSVAEGEIIHVKGRGGGSGWVIGARRTINEAGEWVEGQEGLVPESYLDPVEEE